MATGNPIRFVFLSLALCALGSCALSQETLEGKQSGDKGWDDNGWDKGAMVATANPYATDAAIEVLERGGHAVDAAIAAHLVLGLVEPQSSGIGGGGFLLAYERTTHALTFHDGREVAPMGATADMFMHDGEVMNFLEAWQSGLSVGAPGAVALYKSAHDKHGRLRWADLFAPAIELAEEGFIVSPRLAALLQRLREISRLDDNAASAAYFYPEGSPLSAGTRRDNPEYATTLRRIANEGISAFYTGVIPDAIAAAVQAEPNPGTLTAQDITRYQAVERPVVCGSFRDLKICTTSPPSSGGAQIMIANMYDHLAQREPQDKIKALVDAQRLAYADRDHYFGDPNQVQIPLQDLLNPRYLQHRAQRPFAPGEEPTPGDPAIVLGHPTSQVFGHDTTEEAAGTTHLSVIDKDGNAVAFTATVEAPFGSSRWVHGFLLNNELTDFARDIDPDKPLPANAVAPGKRPRSSMSPTMVFDSQDNLIMVTGSPGGNSIPAYVAKTIVGVLDWNLDAQAAADHPNIIARGARVRVETGIGDGEAIARRLKDQGYDVQEREGENSGIHLIVVRDTHLEGAADSRREGTVRSLQ